MGVAVDEAGREDQPVAVHNPFRGRPDTADFRDAAAGDADIGAEPRRARTVHHIGAADKQIEGHASPPGTRLCERPGSHFRATA